MRKEDCYFLGRIRKPHGLDGELNVFLDVDDSQAYAELGNVLIEIKHELVPYFIERIQIRDGNTAIVKLEGVGPAEARTLAKKELFLPLSRLPRLSGNKFYYHEVTGFMLHDLAFGDIGPVIEVLEYPHQDVFRTLHMGKEVLIPVSDEIIKEVDRKKKLITLDCPEGLIEVYL